MTMCQLYKDYKIAIHHARWGSLMLIPIRTMLQIQLGVLTNPAYQHTSENQQYWYKT